MCESGACPQGRRALRIVKYTVGLIMHHYVSFNRVFRKNRTNISCALPARRVIEAFECQGTRGQS